jgi:iron(III) transport system ATP-binding protein
MAFIEINGLVKRFGAVDALKGIDISIERKEFVTFLGPSGCGKTTTLRTLAGFVAPDGGSIKVDGKILSSADGVVPPEQRGMGMVFQNYAVWPHMTVYENVAFGLRYKKFDRGEQAARVARALTSMGLEGLQGRYPAALSGGQQQRVALARSLVLEPSILLLDEPLSNLDAKLREQMRAELKGLQRRTGITFVYVTHDQAEAMALSDRIAVFRAGRIQQVGSPRDVYERPANLFVADFMGLVNTLHGTVKEARGEHASVEIAGHRLAVTTRAGSACGASVNVAIRPESITFDDAADGPINLLRGVITDATFLGNLIIYQVDVGGLTLRVQGERRAFRPAGSDVVLAVPIADCVEMPREAEEFDPQPGAPRAV